MTIKIRHDDCNARFARVAVRVVCTCVLPSPSIIIVSEMPIFHFPGAEKDNTPPPGELFWSTYLKDAEEEDKYLPKSWEANTGGILTFVRIAVTGLSLSLMRISTDRSVCRDSSSFHHRKLQVVVPRFG